MLSSLGVIGLGRMAQALVFPLIEKQKITPERIFAVVGRQKSVNSLRPSLPKGLTLFSSEDQASVGVWHQPIQLLAVKPQQLEQVAIKAKDLELSYKVARPLLISLLAGVSLKRLQSLFPNHNCVRVVANTPALVGAGLTGISWGDGINQNEKKHVKDLFVVVSEVLELPESNLDAFLALTSSGPAYVALMVEALADGAVAAGLSRDLSLHLASRTLGGTALLLKEKNIHPSELKDMVASPGGTTIAALRHLEKAGFRSALIEAVVLAAERSRELA
ncbi:pyrroline-5-carboxylate reductase [Prochlorococcus sp. MIT 1300]|uniref:pyrroline-5-carboxylate reductase n=1 Tax=Prochlorococcus sp. MIT 1300 TaxID=3096218 RepID=UPI002A74F7EB|nr:pyrroline-5-carboxylate reductase [Prochlorococcus sp. MIT 1300]